MMKQTISILALAMLALFPAAAVGQTVPIGVRVIFNRGVEDPNKTCSSADWDLVEQALDAGFSAGRRLKAGNNERQLMTPYCQRVCSGWPAGMCWRSGTGCENRRLQQESNATATTATLVQMEEAPEVIDALECNEKQAAILKSISTVLMGVNESCRKMIMSNHWLKCYYGV